MSRSLAAGIFLACNIILSLWCGRLEGSSVTLAWNPSPGVSAAGYLVHYGFTSHNYTTVLDVGRNLDITVDGLNPGSRYYFSVSAYDYDDLEGDDSSEVSVALPMLPMIISQPSSQTAQAGATVTIFADVIGEPPITFQWFNGGTAIPGASASLLRLPQVSADDAGSYALVITDSAGSVTSAVATVTVLGPPVPAELGPATETPAAPTNALPIAAAAGTYNGLFYRTNSVGMPAIDGQTTGLLKDCVVDSKGYFAGSIYVAGNEYPIKGVFDAEGNGGAIVDRSALGLPALKVELHVDLAFGTLHMTGTVLNLDLRTFWVATLTADLQTTPSVSPSTFLLTIPSVNGMPPGCVIVTRNKGFVLLIGTLGDGATILQKCPIWNGEVVPIFLPLYHNTGLRAGWLNLSGGTSTAALTWISLTGPKQSGFTNTVQATIESEP